MLRKNVCAELGLCNGSRGWIYKVVLDPREPAIDIPPGHQHILRYQPLYVLVKLRKPDHEPLPGLRADVVPIFATANSWTRTIKRDGKTRSLSYQRRQLPLVPAYCMTTHSAQGQTLRDGVITDLSAPPFSVDAQQYYVILSRAQCLNNVYLLRNFDISVLQQGIRNQNDPLHIYSMLVIEIERLRALEKKTMLLLGPLLMINPSTSSTYGNAGYTIAKRKPTELRIPSTRRAGPCIKIDRNFPQIRQQLQFTLSRPTKPRIRIQISTASSPEKATRPTIIAEFQSPIKRKRPIATTAGLGQAQKKRKTSTKKKTTSTHKMRRRRIKPTTHQLTNNEIDFLITAFEGDDDPQRTPLPCLPTTTYLGLFQSLARVSARGVNGMYDAESEDPGSPATVRATLRLTKFWSSPFVCVINTDAETQGVHWVVALVTINRSKVPSSESGKSGDGIRVQVFDPLPECLNAACILQKFQSLLPAADITMHALDLQHDGWRCGYFCLWWTLWLVGLLKEEHAVPSGASIRKQLKLPKTWCTQIISLLETDRRWEQSEPLGLTRGDYSRAMQRAWKAFKTKNHNIMTLRALPQNSFRAVHQFVNRTLTIDATT
jgi:hypothetical protein